MAVQPAEQPPRGQTHEPTVTNADGATNTAAHPATCISPVDATVRAANDATDDVAVQPAHEQAQRSSDRATIERTHEPTNASAVRTACCAPVCAALGATHGTAQRDSNGATHQ